MPSQLVRGSVLAAVALATLAAGGLAGEAVDLKLKLRPGQVLRYEITARWDLDVETPGSKSALRNSQKLTASYQVVSVDEQGNFRVKMTIQRMAFSIHNPAMVDWPAEDIDYDSGKPEDRSKEKTMTGRMAALMVAGEFTALISPTGSVIESSGMEAIRKKLTAEFPTAASRIARIIDRDACDRLWQSFGDRPAEAKKPGESWRVQKTVSGTMRVDVEARLEAVEGGRALVVPARIDVTFGNMAKPGEKPAPEAELAGKIKVTRQEATGVTRTNLATGAVEAGEGSLTVECEMPDPDSGHTIKYLLLSSGTVRLLPAENTEPKGKQ